MSLVLSENYFARYGEHLSDCGSATEAWERTERDLLRETGYLRRYTTYQSFAVAFSRRKRGHTEAVITFRVAKYLPAG